jgi:hypothetical protein
VEVRREVGRGREGGFAVSGGRRKGRWEMNFKKGGGANNDGGGQPASVITITDSGDPWR